MWGKYRPGPCRHCSFKIKKNIYVFHHSSHITDENSKMLLLFFCRLPTSESLEKLLLLVQYTIHHTLHLWTLISPSSFCVIITECDTLSLQENKTRMEMTCYCAKPILSNDALVGSKGSSTLVLKHKLDQRVFRSLIFIRTCMKGFVILSGAFNQ